MKFIKMVVLASVLSAVAVQAAEKMTFKTADEAIQYRQSAMGDFKKPMRAMDDMIKGKTTWNNEEFAKAASVLDSLATKPWDAFASEDTAVGTYKGHNDNAAKKEIWRNADDFAKKISDFEASTKALTAQAMLNDKDKSKVAFDNMKKTCHACHQAYEQE